MDAVRFLIEKGRAAVDAEDGSGRRATLLAAEAGHADTVACLFFYRAEPSAVAREAAQILGDPQAAELVVEGEVYVLPREDAA